jgi:hypothetical protein
MDARSLLATAALLGLILLGAIWSNPKPTTQDAGPVASETRLAFNGTLQGASGQPAAWSTNLTIPPGTHEVFASASWHGNGPRIGLRLVFGNGSVTEGIRPGNYPFTQARAHADSQSTLLVVLTSETIERFELEVAMRPLGPGHPGWADSR